jgi:hypothetical protein
LSKRTILFIVIALALVASSSPAQELTLNGHPLRDVLTSSPMVVSGVVQPPVVVTQKKVRVADKSFWLTVIGVHASMLLDGKTTFDNPASDHKIHEMDSLARPFIESGPLVSYIAGTAVEAAAMYVAYKMKGSKNKTLRHTWFLIPFGIISVHGTCTIINVSPG